MLWIPTLASALALALALTSFWRLHLGDRVLAVQRVSCEILVTEVHANLLSLPRTQCL